MIIYRLIIKRWWMEWWTCLMEWDENFTSYIFWLRRHITFTLERRLKKNLQWMWKLEAFRKKRTNEVTRRTGSRRDSRLTLWTRRHGTFLLCLESRFIICLSMRHEESLIIKLNERVTNLNCSHFLFNSILFIYRHSISSFRYLWLNLLSSHKSIENDNESQNGESTVMFFHV
jgi:hypothetical protein